MSWKDDLGQAFAVAAQPVLAPHALDGEPVKKPPRHRQPNLYARAVSKTLAARLLGVDKNTLAALIADGAIRTVKWRGKTGGQVEVRRERIPMSEVERLCEQGIPQPGERRARRRMKGVTAANVAEAIRKIELG